ncbi:MAG: hypothetical protein JO161_06355 [Planctomycetaceae bacterium]|nr:hypothetical protein [Planctomycetaceae bacterium]
MDESDVDESGPGRPTSYKGILMRSRIEARFAGWLDRNRFDWEYEPLAFADEWGDYLPDFRVDGIPAALGLDNTSAACPTSPAYVEVKPPGFAVDAVAPDMRRIWASQPDAHLLVVYQPWEAGPSIAALASPHGPPSPETCLRLTALKCATDIAVAHTKSGRPRDIDDLFRNTEEIYGSMLRLADEGRAPDDGDRLVEPWESARFEACSTCGGTSIVRSRSATECYVCGELAWRWGDDDPCPGCGHEGFEWMIAVRPCHRCGTPLSQLSSSGRLPSR